MTEKNINIQELIETFLNSIVSEVWVDEENKSALRQFLYYCINSYKTGDTIPYNVLVEAKDEETGIYLARKIADIGRKILGCKGLECTESEINQYVLEHEEKQTHIALVTEMLPEIPENWDKILKRHNVNSKIIKLYVKSEEDNSRLEKDSFFRWRFLNLHVKKTKMSSIDAYDLLILELTKKDYIFDDVFKAELKEYVEIVYPKAKYKEEEFVKDALLAVEQRARSIGLASKILNTECVPLYAKQSNPVDMTQNVEEPKDEVPKDDDPKGIKVEDIKVDASEITPLGIIESNIVEITPANYDKKNILILALSTVNRDDKMPVSGPPKNPSSFIYGDEFRDDDCIYQLEPVTKYMIENHKGEQINIIELCTEDVVSPDKNGDIAKKYYEERINEYNKSRGYNCDLVFKQINIDLSNTTRGLVDAINELETIKRSNKINHIWMDTHGGFRDVTFMLNSLLSLLKIYEIIPDKIFGVRFNDKRKINEIVDQEESFIMNDFVSGMNEFFNYGSARLLSEYYKKQKTKTSAIDDMVKAMCEVSDGTKLCDPDFYISALNRLGKSIKNYKNLGVPFDIFVDYINTDYGVLLDSTNRLNIDIVERCYKKGMYQQALTFIESLMPMDFVNNHIVYFGANVISINQEIETSAREKHQSKEQYIFEMFVLGCLRNMVNNDATALSVIRGQYGQENIELFTPKKSITVSSNIKRVDKAPYISRDIFLKTDVDEKKYDKATKLILLHKAIKRVRNMTNHSKSENNRPTIQDITRALGKYVDLAKDVMGRQ